jgi:hypothetical protein
MALQRDLISVRTAYQCERGCDLASLHGEIYMRDLFNLAVAVLVAIVFGNLAFALLNHFHI